MAKFNIGDKVIDKTRRYMGAAKIIDETDDEFVVKFDSGPRDMLDKEDAVAANSRVRSRNSVVVKALNACGTARNAALEYDELKKILTSLDKKMKEVKRLYEHAKTLDREVKAELEKVIQRGVNLTRDQEMELRKFDIRGQSPWGSL